MAYTYGETGKCKLGGGDTSSYYQVRLGYQVNSQDITKNTSNVTLRLEVRSTNSSYATYGYNQTSTIDGTALSAKSFDMRSTNTWQVFGERTITVSHNASGKYSASKSGSFTTTASGTYSLKSGSASVTVAPKDIPRYATASQSLKSKSINTISIDWSSDKTIDYVWYSKDNGSSWVAVGSVNASSGSYTISDLNANSTYNIKTRVRSKESQLTTDSSALSVTTYDYAKFTSVPNVNIGSAHTLTWTNPSGASISLILYRTDTGATVQNFGTVTGTSKSVTPTASNIYALIPNSNSITLKYKITTTQNSKTYTDTKDCVFSVVNSNPTFSNFEFEDTDSKTLALTGNKLKFIRKYSDLKVTISSANKMVAKNSATAKSYNVIVGNTSKSITYSDSSVNTTISNMDGNTVSVYAIDSRNNQTSVSKSLTTIDYTECLIKSLRIDRVDGIGTNILISMSGTYSITNFGAKTNNIKAIDIRAKAKSSSSWGSWNSIMNLISITGGKITANNITYSGIDFVLGTEYDIQVRISDELSEDIENTTITDGKVLFSAAKGYGVNFGGLYNTTEGGPLQIDGKQAINKEYLKDISENIRWTTSSVSNVDYNNYKKSGMYYLGSGCSNSPENLPWMRLIVNGNNGGDISQIACSISYDRVYYRRCNNGNWYNWLKVSTNGITDSGSNSNGSYIKYDDGTMICYLNIRVTDQAINTQYGGTNIYFGTRVWTFPQQFINDNVAVTCGTFRWSTGGSWGSTAQPSKSAVQLFGYDLFARATGTDCYISAIAVGCWK